jgi:malate dehydrogenase (oxaloacetate-decarboxylating)
MLLAGTRASEQRVVIFGAGTAGMGIADQIRVVMVADGLSEEEATRRFYAVDKQGLLVDDMSDLRDFQQPYAQRRSVVSSWSTETGDGSIGLFDVVANAAFGRHAGVFPSSIGAVEIRPLGKSDVAADARSQ